MANRWGNNGKSDRLFLGSKITADSDCSHEIKRCLLLRRKAMTNLDSILKSRHYFVDKGPVAARTLVSTSTTSRLSLRSWSTRWSLTCMRHRHSLTASTLCMTSWWCTTKLTIPTAGRPDPPSHPLPQEGAGLTAVTTPTLTSQPQVFCPRSVAEALSPESVLGGRVPEVPQSKPMQSTQRYGFSSSHVWILELDYKESWAPKNCCFWTVVLEKTLESPLDCKETQPVYHKGNQAWLFIGRIDAEAETPILWPPDAKNWLIGKDPDAGKDWRQEVTEDEMVGWHHRLSGHEFE